MPTFKSYAGELSLLADEFRIKGQKEAAGSRPPADAKHPDEHEVQLRTKAEQFLNSEQVLFDAQVGEASKAVVAIEQQRIDLEARAQQLISDNSVLAQVEADLSGERRSLAAAIEARLRAELSWKAFRAEHAITDEAHYPPSHLVHFAWIVGFGLLETIVNAFFYENAQGLLGGFVVALGVSAINMLGATAAGAGFRYKNLSPPLAKAFGWSCFVAFVIFSVYCNSIFASFRSEYQILVDPTDPLQLRQAFTQSMAEAKKVFVLDMQIADLMSFLLFGIGLILSGLAFWKGYTFDDRCPGYGRRDRLLKVAKITETERQDIVRQKLKDFLLACRAKVQAAINEPSQLISRAASQTASAAGAKNTFKTQAEAIRRDHQLVLNAYRTGNAAVRVTDAPAYFGTMPNVAEHISFAPADSAVEALRVEQGNIAVLRDKQQDALSDKLKALQSETTKVLNDTFSTFVKRVEDEVKDNLAHAASTLERVQPPVTT